MVSSTHNNFSYNLGKLAQKKIEVLRELKIIKSKNSDYKILDIGGAKEKHFPEKFNFIDYVLDINSADTQNSSVKSILGNINEEKAFIELEDYVEKNGKFDYCICTHVLEDIRNPQMVIDKINKISKAGLISFPSKYLEMSRFEKPYMFRGFHHHRWIFTISQNTLVGIPKINMIEHKDLDQVSKYYQDSIGELYIEWTEKIIFKTFNGDKLGPTTREVFNKMKELLISSDEDSLVSKRPRFYKSEYFKMFN
jgi:hypothetical protein